MGLLSVVMSTDFLSKERIEEEVKEDFGSAWEKLEEHAKEQLIISRRKRLLKRYKKVGSMGEAVENLRRSQSQMYLGIVLGLSGGLVGAVFDRLLGGYLIYNSLVILVFLGLIITVHFSFDSVVKEMFSFTQSQDKVKKKQSKKK